MTRGNARCKLVRPLCLHATHPAGQPTVHCSHCARVRSARGGVPPTARPRMHAPCSRSCMPPEGLSDWLTRFPLWHAGRDRRRHTHLRRAAPRQRRNMQSIPAVPCHLYLAPPPHCCALLPNTNATAGAFAVDPAFSPHPHPPTTHHPITTTTHTPPNFYPPIRV